ncbi:MAG TPA: HAD family hydrolase [Rhizobiaceae bacterium]|nr:HAD family hydrolase [Rhizobiaceae bacterium]
MAEPTRGPADALHLEEVGLWVQILAPVAETTGRPALFLDRDGTINVDTGYPRTADEIVLLPEILPVIRAANTAGVPAVIVSNQSGVARGLLDWSDFAAVNRRLLDLLHVEGCAIAMVLACAYHEAGRPPFDIPDHPMRKPNPGMLLRAAAILGIDLQRSIVVGDKSSDMEAGRRAGLAEGWLVAGDGMACDLSEKAFSCRPLRDGADYALLVEAISTLSRS